MGRRTPAECRRRAAGLCVPPPRGTAGVERGPRLRYRAPGYELDVALGELDAAAFEQLVSEARQYAEIDDHGRAMRVLDTALRLWRGEVLGEFNPLDLGAEGYVARLVDPRVAATEERAEAMLHADRVAEVVPDPEDLVQRFPHRERLTVPLMRALYAGGRPSEALAAYQRLRRRLVQELGVEPSERTRAVQRQLLERDPGLLTATVPRPTNLPRRGTSFVGRAQETAHLGALPIRRAADHAGRRGRGGQTHAWRWRWRRASSPDSPTGVWPCELAPLDEGRRALARDGGLGVRQWHGLTLEETPLECLQGRRLLLVVDNCEHVLGAAAALVDRILARCPGVCVPATSREPLGIGGEQAWPVRPLPVAEASDLFTQRARAARPEFSLDRDADASLTDICRRLDGLPLAIELTAARMRVMSPAEMARRLDDERLHAPGRRTAQPRHQSLSAAIDWSCRLLSPAEGQRFTQLSVFAGGAGRTETETLDVLTALIQVDGAHREPSGRRVRLRPAGRSAGTRRPECPLLHEAGRGRRTRGVIREPAGQRPAGRRRSSSRHAIPTPPDNDQ